MLPPDVNQTTDTDKQVPLILGDDGELLPDKPKRHKYTKKCFQCGCINAIEAVECEKCSQPFKVANADSRNWSGCLLPILGLTMFFAGDLISRGNIVLGLGGVLVVIAGFIIFGSWTSDQNDKKEK